MPARVLQFRPATLVFIVAILFTAWPAAQGAVRARDVQAHIASATQARAPQAITTIFLPTIYRAPGSPSFVILSPNNGASVSGTSFFAIQPVEMASVTSVRFQAGARNLGTDATPTDGFQVFLDAATLPAGPIRLTATASGPSGTTSKTVDVTIVPNPPTSAAVAARGATLGTTSGNTIVVPAGAVSSSTTVTIQDKTQDQVKAERGIDWAALGVTFLGAIDVQSAGPLAKPLGVSSVGFGTRIQPGQAVVTYQIAPDSDGDGKGELVVVNGANLAPNGTIVSSPISQLAVVDISARTRSSAVGLAQAGRLSGPPGTTIVVRGSGFNPLALHGNVAVFHSLVDGQEIELSGFVTTDPINPAQQIFTTLIPPLASGAATLLLRSESSGATAGPFNVTITTPVALSKPAPQIITNFLADSIAFIQHLPTASPEEQQARDAAAARFIQVRADFDQIVQAGLTPPVEQALKQVAVTIANTELYNLSLAQTTAGAMPSGYDPDVKFSDFLSAFAGVVGIFGAAAAIPTTAATLGLLAIGAGIGLGLLTTGYFACKLIRGGSCFGDPSPTPPAQSPDPQMPACAPAPNAPAGGLTGMGSAPPPGGSGCGSVVCGPLGCVPANVGTQAVMSESSPAGRYTIKVFRRKGGGMLTPFTGKTDRGGYFFIPLIPAGQPFTALAIDTVTGERRTFEGVGPPLGRSTVMFFNFSHDGGPPPGLSAALSAPAQSSFSAFGQQLSLALDEKDDPMLAYVYEDPNNDGEDADTALFFARWDRTNNRWATPVQVAVLGQIYNPRNTDQVALARDASTGTLAVAYTSGGLSTIARVWLARSTNGGATWSAEQVSQAAHGSSNHPALALRSGAFHIAYRTNTGIYYALRSGVSGPFTYAPAPALSGFSSYGDSPVGLALDGVGQPAVAYLQYQGGAANALAFWRPGQPSAVKVAESTPIQPFVPSLSLAFSGNKPRLAYHLRRPGPPASDENQLWLSASNDGATWGEPSRLRDGVSNTYLYQSLALDAQGRAAVAANVLTNSGGACGGPKLARSNDLLNWTACSPDTFILPDTGGTYVNLRFTSNGKLYMAFQFNGNTMLAKGIVLWREP